MKEMIRNWLTARDNRTYSLTKLAFIASISALIYNFVSLQSLSFSEFGLATGGLIAAMAAKYHVEGSAQ